MSNEISRLQFDLELDVVVFLRCIIGSVTGFHLVVPSSSFLVPVVTVSVVVVRVGPFLNIVRNVPLRRRLRGRRITEIDQS